MKKLVFKVFLVLAAMTILGFAMSYIYECYVPPISADVAAKQFDNSNDAYQNLRQVEITKNYFYTAYWVTISALMVVLFWSEISKVVDAIRNAFK